MQYALSPYITQKRFVFKGLIACSDIFRRCAYSSSRSQVMWKYNSMAGSTNSTVLTDFFRKL